MGDGRERGLLPRCQAARRGAPRHEPRTRRTDSQAGNRARVGSPQDRQRYCDIRLGTMGYCIGAKGASLPIEVGDRPADELVHKCSPGSCPQSSPPGGRGCGGGCGSSPPTCRCTTACLPGLCTEELTKRYCDTGLGTMGYHIGDKQVYVIKVPGQRAPVVPFGGLTPHGRCGSPEHRTVGEGGETIRGRGGGARDLSNMRRHHYAARRAPALRYRVAAGAVGPGAVGGVLTAPRSLRMTASVTMRDVALHFMRVLAS